MKLHFTLGRKLLLLVAIPLAGAVVFASAVVVRLALEARELRRLNTSVNFTADLIELRRSLAAEQIATWDLYGDLNGRAHLQAQVNKTELAFGELKRSASSASPTELSSPQIRDTVNQVIGRIEQLSTARSFFLRQNVNAARSTNEAETFRAQYRESINQVVALI